MGSEETKHSTESAECPKSDGESAENPAEVVSGEPAENSAEALSSKSAETSVEANKPAGSEIPAEASKPPEGTTEASDPSEEAILTVLNTPETSKKKTPKSLKAKSKILKNPLAANEPKSINGKGKVVKRRRKKKAVKTALQGNKLGNNKEGANKQTSNDENLGDQAEKGEKSGTENDNKHDPIADEEQTEKSQDKEKTGESADKQQELKEDGKSGGPDTTNGEKKANGRKRKKDSLAEKRKKDKIDGMIFMCNKKTKPDCFRYGVMGVSIGKKDTVLGIKRGTKLFLYDFDHKLLHGVYKATSRGDVKLEPDAFGGAFPAQVRFEMHKDCKPLPEAVFKKAIKENYYGNKKFNTQLTFLQVKKLMTLFKPAEAHASTAVHSLPAATTTKTEDKGTVVREKETPTRDKGKVARDKEAPARNKGTRKPERESKSRSTRKEEPRSRRTEKPRDSLRDGESRSRHPPPPRERAREPRREASPRNLYLTEKEYRAYGLRGERRNLVPDFHPRIPDPPIADHYRRDFERDRLLRRPDIPGRADPPVYPIDRDYRRSYSPVERRDLAPLAPRASDPYASDPYYSRYFSEAIPASASYLPLPRRDEIPSYSARGRREDYLPETDPLRRRDELNPLRRRDELDSLRRREELDSLRRREESDSLRRREESDSLRRREESDSLRRREIDELDRLYSTYGSEGYPGYHRRHEDPVLPASSSRYLDGRSYLSR